MVATSQLVWEFTAVVRYLDDQCSPLDDSTESEAGGVNTFVSVVSRTALFAGALSRSSDGLDFAVGVGSHPTEIWVRYGSRLYELCRSDSSLVSFSNKIRRNVSFHDVVQELLSHSIRPRVTTSRRYKLGKAFMISSKQQNAHFIRSRSQQYKILHKSAHTNLRETHFLITVHARHLLQCKSRPVRIPGERFHYLGLFCLDHH